MAKKQRQSKPVRGRPPMPEGISKANVLTVRMQPAEREAIDAKAAASGQRVSDWVRLTLLAAVGRVKVGKSEAEGVGVEPHR